MPAEHVYLKYTGSVNLEKFRMITDNLASASMAIVALGEDILQKDVIDINVMDSVTNNLIETYRGCTAESYDTSYRANDIVTEQISFLFLSCSNSANS